MAADEEIRPLTGLRGVAALWVFAFHFEKVLLLPFLFPGNYGRLGVELFFVLSGYVLCQRYLSAGRGPFLYRPFVARRFARLYPAYLATHALMGAVFAWALAMGAPDGYGSHLSPWGAVANLLMIQAWGTVPVLAWNAVAWSVSAEWVAYLALFPFVVWAMGRPQARWILLGAFLATAAILLAYALDLCNGYLIFDRTGGLRVLPTFLLGALVWTWRGELQGLAADLVALAAFAVIAWSLHSGKPVDVLLLPFFGAVVLGVAGQGPLLGRLLGHPWAVGLGRISYSFYLTHMAVLIFWGAVRFLTHWRMGATAQALLCLGVQLPLAYACWRWVEEPGRRWLGARLA